MSIMATSNLLALSILLYSSVLFANPDSFRNERFAPLSVFVRSSREIHNNHLKKAPPLPPGLPAGAVTPKRGLPALEKPFSNHLHSRWQKKWPFRFQYVVDDEATGNFQTRHEEGDAQGAVRGCYQVLEPTGLVRTVSYKADSRGFRVLSITNDPDKIPCTAPESEETPSPFEEAFNQNLDGPHLVLNQPFYSSKFREASRNQLRQDSRFSSQNFGAFKKTSSTPQAGYNSRLTSSSRQKSHGRQFGFGSTYQSGGRSVAEKNFSQTSAHASALNVNSKFKNKSSKHQSRDYEKNVDESFKDYQSTVEGKSVHNIDQIQTLGKYEQISNQDSTKSYAAHANKTDNKEAYKATETHTNDEWMAEYLQSLSKSIFSTFKNITALSIANGDYSKHINFPFVLIPITSFLRLRNKGLVDKDVQGFGTVIQQKNIGAEMHPPKRVQKIISNIYNTEIKTTNQIKSSAQASRTQNSKKVERVKHSFPPAKRIQRDFKPSAPQRNSHNDTPIFNHVNSKIYSDINKRITPRKFLYLKGVKDHRPGTPPLQSNGFSEFKNENSKTLFGQSHSPVMHLPNWQPELTRNSPSEPPLGSNYEINPNLMPKPWHLPYPHTSSKTYLAPVLPTFHERPPHERLRKLEKTSLSSNRETQIPKYSDRSTPPAGNRKISSTSLLPLLTSIPLPVSEFVPQETVSGKAKEDLRDLSKKKTSSTFTSPPVQNLRGMTPQLIPNIKDRTTIT